MPERATDEDLELLDELGVDTAPERVGGRSPRERRIIAGFEEIERFVEQHGRLPLHGEDRDIFERLYAVRLDQIRASAECREVLKALDTRGLLAGVDPSENSAGNDEPTDEQLLTSLGIAAREDNDVTRLVHVRSRDEIKAAEEIAQRYPCGDFDRFKPIFEAVGRELSSGARQTVKYADDAEVRKGDLFILDGQKIIIPEVGERFTSDYGRPDRRLRVVYDNGTESDLLVRSLQRALNKDKTSRRIKEPGFGPLFADVEEPGDVATGSIYVLRSKSDHPYVAEHRNLIHKIGFTKGEVAKRVAAAKNDPTYLLSDVEIVAIYKLVNINRKALESLLHRFFGSARLDMELKDRFGSQVEPREWFLIPMPVIDEAIQRIKDGSIGRFRYDAKSASLVPA